jgi:outer membrane protein assembly factor BamB
MGIEDDICPQITVQDGIQYATDGRRSKLIAIRSGGSGAVTESHKMWEIAKGSHVSSPVCHDGHLYWAKEQSKFLSCANAATGELFYRELLERSHDNANCIDSFPVHVAEPNGSSVLG